MLRNYLSIALLGLSLAGCAVFEAPPQPAPGPEPVAEPEPAAPPPPPVVIEEPPPPPPGVVEEPPPPPPLVAIVLSSRAPAYESVALELAKRLPATETYDLADRSLSVRDAFDAIRASGAAAVVAIGLKAAVHARDASDIPVVFAQVFNVRENDLEQTHMRGVAVLPPLAEQLAHWREVAPAMRSVGAIVGEGHEALLEEAGQAAAAEGLAFHSRVASSDRETLYLFTRMAPEIDGYWLFPDNRILSGAVLREMLAYANRHGVQVAAFNESLLELGATLAATSDAGDVADTVVDILASLAAGEFAAVPPLTPLTETRTSLHESLRRRLQLAERSVPGAER